MSDKWYYSTGNQRLGPVTEDEIKRLVVSGQVQPNDLVWKEGMAQWTKAHDVAGLNSPPALSLSEPPPLPQAQIPVQPQVKAPATPPAQPPAKSLAQATTPKTWRTSSVVILLLFVIWPLFWLAAYLVWKHPLWSKRKKGLWLVFGLLGSACFANVIFYDVKMSPQYQPSQRTTRQTPVQSPEKPAISDAKTMVDFNDHADQYKGKTLAFRATYHAADPLDLKETAQIARAVDTPFRVHFETGQGNVSYEMQIEIPATLPNVPRLNSGDDAIVTFTCTNGELSSGNIAQEIRRP